MPTTGLSSIPIRLRIKKHKRNPPGSAPGTITPDLDAKAPKIFVTSYGASTLRELPASSIEEVKLRIEQHSELVHWIEVKGFADRSLLEQICEIFEIHPLEMEDVVNTYQRPKLEEHHKHLFIVSRAMVRCSDELLRNDQLSLFVGKNYVISMQDKYEDCFEPLRARIRSGKGNLRTSGTDYLMYSLLDSIVDSYFPLLEGIGEKLDELEDVLFARPTRESLQQIQNIKRELIVFRRTVFAERDKINDLLRSENDFVTKSTKIYLKDTYDHTIQVMDLVESYKEITASLMDIYLSSVSNRMNGIMKVLAVISTIFIPLTFIVGVYGMNFSRENPDTGQVMPFSMPELYSPYGYVGVMIFMLVVVIIQLLIFWKKGWLEKN
jgi:magnesium transporter